MAEMKNTFLMEHLMTLGGMRYWPSQVPSNAQMNEFIPELCKVPYDYLYRDDPVAMAECTLLVHEYTGLDSVAANLDIYNFEGEAIGAKINYFKKHIPDFDRSDFFVKGWEDLDKVKFQGLDKGRLPYLLEYGKAYAKYTGFPYEPAFSAPWSLACNLYGPENLIIDTMEDPDFVHELLRRISEDVHVPLFKELRKIIPGYNGVSLADAFCSPPMVSVDILKDFNLPCKELIEKGVGEGFSASIAGFWGFSLVQGAEREEMLDLALKLAGAFTIFDPDVVPLGLDYGRKLADEKLAMLIYGLSTTFIEKATPAQIVESTRDYVLAGKAGITPFMMMINNISPFTPMENVHAFVDAVKVYGAPDATADTPMVHTERPSFEEFIRNKMVNNAEGYTFDWIKHSELAI